MRPVSAAVVLTLLTATACVVAVHETPQRVYVPPPAPRPAPPPPVAVGDEGPFFAELEPHGRWTELPPYGWVWTPARVAPGWRPYTVGRWIDTDDGWYWDSEEPWGWATYHYGRWTRHPRAGWVWVPGREWAPCWVAWRHGGGWIGWAPLPPGAIWRAGIGLDLGGDVNVVIQASWWGFVEDRYFLEPRVAVRLAPPERVTVLVRSTPHVTRYLAERDRVVVRGVDPRRLEQAYGRPVPKYRLDEDDAHDRGRHARAAGHDVRVYRPRLAEASPTRPAPERAEGARPWEQVPEKAEPVATAPPAGRPERATRPAPARRPSPQARPIDDEKPAPPARAAKVPGMEVSPPIPTPPPQRAQVPKPAAPDAPQRAEAARPPVRRGKAAEKKDEDEDKDKDKDKKKDTDPKGEGAKEPAPDPNQGR